MLRALRRLVLVVLLVAMGGAIAGEGPATAPPAAPPKSPPPEGATTAVPATAGAPVPAEEEHGTVLGKNLWQTFRAGGFLMWPILACSVIGVAFIIERAIALREAAIVPRGLGRAVVQAARDGARDEARELCAKRPSGLARVLAAGLAVADRSREEIITAMQEAGEREQWQMDRFNRPLSIVTSVAPLLGLLGTVQGMIMSFDVVARKGAMGDPRQLAAGVATALLTTFAGLTVAIPCYCFYHYYRDKADRMIVQIEDAASHLVDALKGSEGNANPPPQG